MMPTPKTRRYRKILCGVDFSAQSACALRYAAAIGSGPGDTITAVHAGNVPRADLDRFVARTLGAVTAARVKTAVANGRPDLVVIAHAGRRKTDVIVMGTGSNTLKVLRGVEGPVLVVPPRCRRPRPGWPAGPIGAAIGHDDRRRRAQLVAAVRAAHHFGGWLSIVPAAPQRGAAGRPGLIIYPHARADRRQPWRQGSPARAFVLASRVPVLVVRTGHRHAATVASRAA